MTFRITSWQVFGGESGGEHLLLYLCEAARFSIIGRLTEGGRPSRHVRHDETILLIGD